MANQDFTTAIVGLLTVVGAFTLLHWFGLGLILKVVLAAAAAVGVIALYKLSQGGDLDTAARDIKQGTKNAMRNADAQANRAADGVRRRT
ncbi:hypothetical protein WJX73_005297 [Symbiochloris irregularis]|uniref:Uncharacterized protein n=1 Tax=Symbiochloris irregularis TaxID=706552 RepID=A0AAW1NNP6_9CHLO